MQQFISGATVQTTNDEVGFVASCLGRQMQLAPGSMQLSSVFNFIITLFNSLPVPTSNRRIQQTGLKQWPNLSAFVQQRILTSV